MMQSMSALAISINLPNEFFASRVVLSIEAYEKTPVMNG